MKQKKLYLLISLLEVYSLSSNFSLADTINSYQGSGNDSPIKSGDEIIINNEGNILYGIDSTGGQFNLEKNSISIDTSIFKEEQLAPRTSNTIYLFQNRGCKLQRFQWIKCKVRWF